MRNIWTYSERTFITFIECVEKKIYSEVDSLKISKLLLEKQSVSSVCVLIIDEMHLQKSVQYHSRYSIGQDEEGNSYKQIVVITIVSLKNSIPIIIRPVPETKTYW